MATPITAPVEEGKLLSESLSTVKIQVQQMKRHLVCDVLCAASCQSFTPHNLALGTRPADGRAQERESHVGRAQNFFPHPQTVL